MSIHVSEQEEIIPRHGVPDLKPLGLVSEYIPSRDKIESNLLVMFHGLGDTIKPFANLAKSIQIPQTAFLVIQGPLPIPLLDEPAFQYYDSFDMLGELIPHPNPSKIVDTVVKAVHYLTETLKWTERQIHFFGYGQGGSVALEVAKLLNVKTVTTVEGELLSHPASSNPKDDTHVLFISRNGTGSFVVLERIFTTTQVEKLPGQGMLRGPEWRTVMVFLSKHITQVSELQLGKDVYSVK